MTKNEVEGEIVVRSQKSEVRRCNIYRGARGARGARGVEEKRGILAPIAALVA